HGIAGSEQYGLTKNGHDQIAIDLAFSGIDETGTTFLPFSEAAAPYSVERLRALGWQGDDLSNLVGIDANEVDVLVKYEMWDGKERMKIDVVTGGGGRVVLKETMDDKAKRAFAAKFKGLVSASKSADAAMSGAGFPFGANQPQKAAGGVKL